MAYKFETVVELLMSDGALHRYLQGDVPEGDYLSARVVHSYHASSETIAKFGIARGKGQIVKPTVALEPTDPSPPSAAPQEEQTMSSNAQLRAAIRELGAISRNPSHPDQHRAKRALREMYDSLDDKPSARVVGASYTSAHAEELDRVMGLSTAGHGVRVEGSQLILSAAGRGQR
jgi:hypothetical protein